MFPQKQPGRPVGSKSKIVFNLVDAINLCDKTTKQHYEAYMTGVAKWMHSKGRNLMRLYLGGGKLTERQKILAKCADCMAGYEDGKYSCENLICPLYPTMPYRNKIKNKGENNV